MNTVSFKGGLKLPVTGPGSGRPIIPVPPGEQVVVPMKQDLGPECEPVVKKKQMVQAGELIGKSPLEHGACLHAPVSGKVINVTKSFIHFSGKRMSAVILAKDGPTNKARRADGDDLLGSLFLGGLVDFDKDTVPLPIKLDEAKLNHVDSLIVNAMDVEPFFSSRIRVLTERLHDVLAGIKTVRDFLNIKQVFIVFDQELGGLISDHQIRNLGDVILVPLKYKYPQAIDYLLVKAVLGKEVMCTIPCRDIMHSQDIDGLVLSVDTLASLGSRLISTERVITVRDSSGRLDENVQVQIGTPVNKILETCSYQLDPESRIVAGGPMMGQTLADPMMPVTKDLQGIFILDKKHIIQSQPGTCIKCGLCVDVCPARLMPFMISGSVENAEYDQAQKYQLSSCFECGCCTYVCPSNIPLLHWIQFGKFEIFKQRSKL
ncbi:RnfABCDGE type electron transport complex subunit C [Desulfonatronovibrio hydrogenovorans]|uniref:RnfABCDGE type electron transport complex subunit C n=1 Tax=Desulfonatronovibrio hydrogenovorans TaxID=53245 RepID=UPI00048F791D|nr:RnfABCDGE type electron transport complex subunit C [Desulfonatronovibrio hydrogenovorans]